MSSKIAIEEALHIANVSAQSKECHSSPASADGLVPTCGGIRASRVINAANAERSPHQPSFITRRGANIIHTRSTSRDITHISLNVGA